ncbi:TrkA C-terminal domain-containing protein [Salinirubellus salinus]|uniref:TrkA C-terminal domain-containing protein n=1 Tax=Salinirubellus salinus TaxID=1364945 RepID=A0A9E7U6W5_9EURY|nr:TrkA C-terminal domain-containing protein [Salinirubellus salinus]UWM52831.1 TrkA C-terminal domain-containing protein [Salinirubellus salinus]
MASLPVEVLLGIYLGILTGIIPGLVAWTLGFVFKYVTGVSIPGFGVVVLGLAIAGVNGGLLALNDAALRQNASATAIVVAIVVVLMLTLYAHAKGDAMGATFPRRVSLQGLRERTLSTDVVELVGGRGQVRLRVVGEVDDIEGYPPLSPATRTAIREGDWRLPADLPLGELETRFAERLRTEFDCSEVTVGIDERGNASVAAAPPLSGVSKRVPTGERAVSVETLVPTGLTRGDEITVHTAETTVAGTVVSVRSDGAKQEPSSVATNGGTATEEDAMPPSSTPAAAGGEGRVTVAVARSDAPALLRADRARVVVAARGTRREFELVSLLRRAGRRFRRLTVRPDGGLDGVTLGSANVREEYGVAVLAVRSGGTWTFAPRGEQRLAAGDEVFAIGTRDALSTFAGVVG